MSSTSLDTVAVGPVTDTHDPEKLKTEDYNDDSEKKLEDPYKVFIEEEDDPKNVSTSRKWIAVLVISLGAMCVTCASSVAGFTELAIAKEFGVTQEATILGLSLYVLGLGIGPLLVSRVQGVIGYVRL